MSFSFVSGTIDEKIEEMCLAIINDINKVGRLDEYSYLYLKTVLNHLSFHLHLDEKLGILMNKKEGELSMCLARLRERKRPRKRGGRKDCTKVGSISKNQNICHRRKNNRDKIKIPVIERTKLTVLSNARQ